MTALWRLLFGFFTGIGDVFGVGNTAVAFLCGGAVLTAATGGGGGPVDRWSPVNYVCRFYWGYVLI